MGLFDRLVTGADAVTTQVMGTRVEIIPRTVPARLSVAAPDPSRAVVEVRGIYSDAPDDGALQGQRHGSGAGFKGNTVVVTATRTLWLSAATVSALGYDIREGDAVRLLEMPGQPLMSVAMSRSSELNDLSLTLTPEPQP